MEPTDAARVTALWLARRAREAGGLVEPPVSPQTCQVAWREFRPRGGVLAGACGLPGRRGLARGSQGFMWLPLAWSSAGRRTPRALTGRPWHRGRSYVVGSDRGRKNATDGVVNDRGRKPDRARSVRSEHRPRETLPGQSGNRTDRARGGAACACFSDLGGLTAGALPALRRASARLPLSRLSAALRCPASRAR